MRVSIKCHSVKSIYIFINIYIYCGNCAVVVAGARLTIQTMSDVAYLCSTGYVKRSRQCLYDNMYVQIIFAAENEHVCTHVL